MTRPHIRDLGYGPGYYTPGKLNSILDVPGVQVGQKTIHNDEGGVHVGVTLIYPRGTVRTRTQPSYAAIHTLNGGGEMTGTHFIRDWGYTSSVRFSAFPCSLIKANHKITAHCIYRLDELRCSLSSFN